MIGVATCGNIDVQTNLIICEPPQKRPRIPEEPESDNRIRVKVHLLYDFIIQTMNMTLEFFFYFHKSASFN